MVASMIHLRMELHWWRVCDTFQIVAAFPCYMMSDDVVKSEGHVIDVDNTRLGAPQERAALDENQMIDNNNSTSIQSSPFAIYRQDGYKFTGGYELFLKTLQSLVDPYGIHRIIIGHNTHKNKNPDTCKLFPYKRCRLYCWGRILWIQGAIIVVRQ